MDVMIENKVVPKLRFRDFDADWIRIEINQLTNPNIKYGIVDGPFGSNLKTIHYKTEGIPIIKSGYVTNGYFKADKYLYVTEEKYNKEKRSSVKGGDIVMAKIGARCGASAILPKNHHTGILSGNALKISIDENRHSTYFIWLKLLDLHISHKFEMLKTVGAQPAISMANLKKFKLYVPSLTEQQKIASFLSAVDEKLQQLTKKKDLLGEYKKGVMQKIFSQELRFKDDKGNNYPDWEEKRLNEVFHSKRGSGLSGKNIVSDGKNKCILYGALYTKYDEVIDEVIESTNEDGKVKSQIGDILVPASTTTTGIDLANFTALNQEEILLGGDITILRFINKGSNIYWAYYLTHYKKYNVAAFAQGSTIVHIYFSHFGKIQIEEPSLKEQQKIANFLSSLDRKIEIVNIQIENTKSFKKGLLQQMFV